MDLSALPVTLRAVVPESYLDEMGHMNVMWYTHLFGRATDALFGLFGFDLDYMKANQAGAFALEIHTRYLAEVRASRAVTVRSRALGRSAKRLHYLHFMVRDDDGVLAATEECVGTHVDLRTRRSSPLPAAVAEAFDRLAAAHARCGWEPPLCGVMRPRAV
jgi:acyl-CoA thioester hydrolase